VSIRDQQKDLKDSERDAKNAAEEKQRKNGVVLRDAFMTGYTPAHIRKQDPDERADALKAVTALKPNDTMRAASTPSTPAPAAISSCLTQSAAAAASVISITVRAVKTEAPPLSPAPILYGSLPTPASPLLSRTSTLSSISIPPPAQPRRVIEISDDEDDISSVLPFDRSSSRQDATPSEENQRRSRTGVKRKCTVSSASFVNLVDTDTDTGIVSGSSCSRCSYRRTRGRKDTGDFMTPYQSRMLQQHQTRTENDKRFQAGAIDTLKLVASSAARANDRIIEYLTRRWKWRLQLRHGNA
jgi:hypothetical protein